MSIYVLSDDSEHSHHEEFDFMKKYEEDACVDLTEEDVEPDNEPYHSPYNDPYEDFLPPIQLSGPVSSLGSSQGTSASSMGTTASLSSGYGSASSSGSKRGVEDKGNKSKKTAERVAKKQRLAQDRLAKLAAAEANRIYKPGECMKYMHCEMHPSLLGQWYCADVARELAAAGARLDPSEDICDPALVLWSRRVPQTLGGRGQVELTPGRQACPRALLVSTAEETALWVRRRSLARRVSAAAALAARPVTLLVHGFKGYFKASNRKTQNSSRDLITEIELEMALTDLLVTAGCDAVLVDTPNELAMLIAQFTKAIAEEPYKKIKRDIDEQAEFYMRGDNKKCVPVDKDGNGASRLWQQMIAILPGSSLETSRSVCARYKSPLALYQALQVPNGVNELADIGVSRAGVPGSKARRLGPEFARKLRILFTAEDGDVLID